eukprot:1150768-Pelagomonas_calceolata.AAC.6
MHNVWLSLTGLSIWPSAGCCSMAYLSARKPRPLPLRLAENQVASESRSLNQEVSLSSLGALGDCFAKCVGYLDGNCFREKHGALMHRQWMEH